MAAAARLLRLGFASVGFFVSVGCGSHGLFFLFGLVWFGVGSHGLIWGCEDDVGKVVAVFCSFSHIRRSFVWVVVVCVRQVWVNGQPRGRED